MVIDDPISSLSHNYIYEVASMIYHNLIKSQQAKHIIILTHNLFFYQEMILSTNESNHNKKMLRTDGRCIAYQKYS
ncbi:AAA family ATPase [Sodalis ligni]|uniref:AAA family ATPase n=1 Tax=Sodalis ligni TaxID=2697027 RepID=UPI001BDE07D1|nr:AAA family ATPase [Sodalis ligni]